MIVSGLTGGIASGKSTVASFFEDAGALIIDADRIARAVVKAGMPAHREIVRKFGQEVLLSNGEINRALLGDIIFKNPDKKLVLNRIVHPRVIQKTDKELQTIKKQHPDAVVILDVPLLFESGMAKNTPEIIVVYVPEQIQLERLMRRDRFSREDALARIKSQMPLEEKKKLATFVIDNSGTVAQTRARTVEVYGFLESNR